LFDGGLSDGSMFMVVVCDTFDHEDYPVYAKDETECRKQLADHHGKNMQRVMEVYDLRLDKSAQIGERGAWHPPAP
jgi:hypothetical protein